MRLLCTWAGFLILAPMAALAQEAAGDPLEFVKKGEAQNVNGDLDGALESFNHALALDAHDSAAYEGRGETRLLQGDAADAEADFARTLQIEPDNEPAIYHRGLAEIKEQSFDAAIADFTLALGLANTAPGEAPNLLLARGRAQYLKGDLDRALPDFNQVAKLKPETGEGFFLRGLTENDQGRLDAAANDFRKAAELKQPEAALWWWSAKTQASHADDANAGLPPLLASAQADPWETELGNLLLEKTTETQVQADAQSAKPGDTRQLEAWFFLGLSREISGDKAGARQAYQQTQASGDPNSPLVVEACRHSKKLSP